jgi:flagellar capping protein FliD
MAKKKADTIKKSKEEIHISRRTLPITVAHFEELTKELNFKITTIDINLGNLTKRVDSVEKRLNDKIDSVENSLNNKIDAVEKRLNDKIDSVEKKLNDKIDAVEKRLNDKIDAVEKTLIYRIDSKIDALSAKMDLQFGKMDEKIQRMLILSEEEHTRSNIVMDHLNTLFARQERFETEIRKENEDRFKIIEAVIKGV